ncbi:swi2 snf2-containing protein rad26 [Cystoisospora suis]|uniref:Swi2 snf2-containing protein rad26 n=1 Tax=Cystoisospora suis TaxID=483139 RepID=A0A2C6LIK2_9APIC|nr:swi2 snf2-containing protein rad26 [Cystoisospora suis]
MEEPVDKEASGKESSVTQKDTSSSPSQSSSTDCSSFSSRLPSSLPSSDSSSLSSSLLASLGVRSIFASTVEQKVQEELEKEEERAKQQQLKKTVHPAGRSRSRPGGVSRHPETEARNDRNVSFAKQHALEKIDETSHTQDEEGKIPSLPDSGVYTPEGRREECQGLDALVEGFASRLRQPKGEKTKKDERHASFPLLQSSSFDDKKPPSRQHALYTSQRQDEQYKEGQRETPGEDQVEASPKITEERKNLLLSSSSSSLDGDLPLETQARRQPRTVEEEEREEEEEEREEDEEEEVDHEDEEWVPDEPRDKSTSSHHRQQYHPSSSSQRFSGRAALTDGKKPPRQAQPFLPPETKRQKTCLSSSSSSSSASASLSRRAAREADHVPEGVREDIEGRKEERSEEEGISPDVSHSDEEEGYSQEEEEDEEDLTSLDEEEDEEFSIQEEEDDKEPSRGRRRRHYRKKREDEETPGHCSRSSSSSSSLHRGKKKKKKKCRLPISLSLIDDDTSIFDYDRRLKRSLPSTKKKKLAFRSDPRKREEEDESEEEEEEPQEEEEDDEDVDISSYEENRSHAGSSDARDTEKGSSPSSSFLSSSLSSYPFRIPKSIWDSLYTYQREGVCWLKNLLKKSSGGILADEMGLGKTIQTVAFISALHHSKLLHAPWEFERHALMHRVRSLRHQEDIDTTDLTSSFSSGSLQRREGEGRGNKQTREDGGGVLIVCPATVLRQWSREFHLWYPPMRVCLFHLKSYDRLEEAARVAEESHGVLLTTYETLRLHLKLLLKFVWKVVILDEGQKIRNPHASITLAVKHFPTPHRLLLSATPIQNNLQEFWSLLDFAAPGRLGTLPVFTEQIADPITMGGYANVSRDRVETAYRCACVLRKIALPLVLRRSKKELQESVQLPEKAEEVLLCHMSPEQYELYVEFLETQKAKFAKLADIDDGDDLDKDRERRKRRRRTTEDEEKEERRRLRILFTLTILRKIANHPDLLVLQEKDRLIDYGNPARSGKLLVLREILKVWKGEGRRVLLFAQTIQMLDILQLFLNKLSDEVDNTQEEQEKKEKEDRGEREMDHGVREAERKKRNTSKRKASYSYLRLDGRVPVTSRHRVIETFQKDPEIFVLLLTTRVGGVGLNLTAADRVVIVDPDWNPMTDMQARERSWRIGQKKNVCIYRLITVGSVEERIYQRQIFKFFLSQKVFHDPRQRKFFKRNDLHELLDPPPPPPGYSQHVTKSHNRSNYKEKIREGIGKEQEETTGDKSFSMHAKDACRKEDRHAGKTRREDRRVEEDSSRTSKEGETKEKEKEEEEKMSEEDIYMNETIRACRQAIAAGVDTGLRSTRKTLLEGGSTKKSRREHEEGDKKEEEEKNEVEDLSRENNLIIQTLLDAKGIQASLVHGNFEQPLLDPSIVDAQSRDIARAAMRALENSRQERMSHGIDVPTWTGKRGRAGLPSSELKRVASYSSSSSTFPFSSSSSPSPFSSSLSAGENATAVLSALRRLQESMRTKSLSDTGLDGGGGRNSRDASHTNAAKGEVHVSFEDKQMASDLLHFFLSHKHSNYAVTTGEVLEAFAPRVPTFRRKIFRSLLKELCDMVKGEETTQTPSLWILKESFRPDVEDSKKDSHTRRERDTEKHEGKGKEEGRRGVMRSVGRGMKSKNNTSLRR